MKCSFCSAQFSEEECAATCGKCALFGGCRMLKCPRCGYEMPQTTDLLKLLTRFGKRKARAQR